MNFNELNAHPRDPYLRFDAETHTYSVGSLVLKSVTNIVEDCFPKFDADYWAQRKAPALGLTPEELKRQWEQNAARSRALGTAMHEKIERYYLGSDAGDDGDAYALFRHFAAAERLYPYRTEWRIFMENYGVAGTLDFLERRPDGTFNIYDWKRSKKLIAPDGTVIRTSRYGTKGLRPVCHLHDCSYHHYSLQLSIYRFILEKCYGIHVSGLRLGVFHPDYKMAYVFSVPYLAHEAEAVLRTNAGLMNPNTASTYVFC